MSSEEQFRLHRCCFTGHRPEKLNQSELHIIAALEEEIRAAIADGYTTFISGMARGVDIWAAQIVLRAKSANSSIRLVCAIPYPNFEMRWSKEWQEQYHSIVASADYVKYISDRYIGPQVFMMRNMWMVDHSSRVIAIDNGIPGGTQNTIEYAQNSGIEIKNLTCSPKRIE